MQEPELPLEESTQGTEGRSDSLTEVQPSSLAIAGNPHSPPR